jgi:hypothetical protein
LQAAEAALANGDLETAEKEHNLAEEAQNEAEAAEQARLLSS